MIPDAQQTLDEQRPVEQGQPTGASPPATPPAPPSDMGAVRPEAAPPPLAAPPAPPGGRLAARVQRMPPAGRWTLGLTLAFLSGVVYLFSPYVGFGNIPVVGTALAILVLFVLALAAGFVLSSWGAVLALAVAALAGGVVASVVFALAAPSAGEGLLAVVAFALLVLAPLILFLLAGVGLGKQQGIALGEPHALSAREAGVSRWIAALAPVLGAGYLALPVGYIPGMQLGIEFTISSILYAVVLAASCLLAGWLLRSWWGLVVAPVVYAGVALLATWVLGGGGDWQVWLTGYGLYIVLPAVVMSAVGTAIGMYRARRAGPPPPQGQLAV